MRTLSIGSVRDPRSSSGTRTCRLSRCSSRKRRPPIACSPTRRMLTLGDLQASIRDAILSGDASAVASFIAPDGLEPEARLRIYANHVLDTLTAVLESTFPVVRRLVDRR